MYSRDRYTVHTWRDVRVRLRFVRDRMRVCMLLSMLVSCDVVVLRVCVHALYKRGWIFGVATEKFKEIEKNASDYAGTSCNAPSLKASAPATVAEKKRVRMTSKCSKDIQKGRFTVWYTANYNNETCHIILLLWIYYIKNIAYLLLLLNVIELDFNLN